MPNPKVATQVAAHDAANRKAADEAAEEAELQARIARQLKPAQGPAPSASPVMATPAIAASFVESGDNPDAKDFVPITTTGSAPALPSTMPDGTPIKRLTREDKLEIALKNLVNKLEEMAANESFKEVWKTALASGVVYKGPLWKPEVDFAKTLLK